MFLYMELPPNISSKENVRGNRQKGVYKFRMETAR